MTTLEIGGTIGAWGGFAMGAVVGFEKGILLGFVGVVAGGLVGYIAGIILTIVILAVIGLCLAGWNRLLGRAPAPGNPSPPEGGPRDQDAP